MVPFLADASIKGIFFYLARLSPSSKETFLLNIVKFLLGLLVWFISHHDKVQGSRPIWLSLWKPFQNVVKALFIRNVITDYCPNRATVIASSDSLKALLASLNRLLVTVSQICNLILFSPIVIFLAPNSTPIVT